VGAAVLVGSGAPLGAAEPAPAGGPAAGALAGGSQSDVAAPASGGPLVGQPAPPFALVDAKGTRYTNETFRGKQGVVLAWFPKAFTPGCTIEIQSLRDSAAALDAYDVAYFMVSLDPADRNQEFAETYQGKFPVLSDATGATAKAYGVVDAARTVPWRHTFYIDQAGVLRAVDQEVAPPTAGPDVVKTLEQLGFPKR